MYATILLFAGSKRIAKRDYPKARETGCKVELAAKLTGLLANAVECGSVKRPQTTH